MAADQRSAISAACADGWNLLRCGPGRSTIFLMEVSRRLTRFVDSQFPKGSSERVLEELRDLPDGVIGGQDPERIQASLVIGVGGDWSAFQQRLDLAH
jgi:hypothetical protein